VGEWVSGRAVFGLVRFGDNGYGRIDGCMDGVLVRPFAVLGNGGVNGNFLRAGLQPANICGFASWGFTPGWDLSGLQPGSLP